MLTSGQSPLGYPTLGEMIVASKNKDVLGISDRASIIDYIQRAIELAVEADDIETKELCKRHLADEQAHAYFFQQVSDSPTGPIPEAPGLALRKRGAGESRAVDIDALGPETLRAFYFGERRIRDRNHAEVKWRASGDPEMPDVRVLTGYPAVTGQATVLYENADMVLRETIAPGAFANVLQDDCHLNYSHESPSAMCRNGITGPGGMELTEDSHGLRIHALVPMDDLDAQRLAPKMDRGVVDQMSFAFTVGQEDCLTTEDEDGRAVYDYTINSIAHLYDVCVCPLGAYSQTEAMLRSVFTGRSLEGHDNPARSQEGQDTAQGRSPEGHEETPVRSHEGPDPRLEDAIRASLRFKPKEA